MKFNILIRRIHVYSGLFLLIFFTRYGITAIPFAHNSIFNNMYKDKPQWVTRHEKLYERTFPEDADVNDIGGQILEDEGIESAFGVYKPNKDQVNIHTFSFFSTARVMYFIKEKRIVVEDKTFRWDHFLTQFHWRGGFMQDSLLHDTWGVVIDIVCLCMLFWIVSGLYMWWKKTSARLWGIVAISGGFVTFVVLMIGM